MGYDYDLEELDDESEGSSSNKRLLFALGGIVGLVVVIAIIALIAIIFARRNADSGEIIVDLPSVEETEAPTFTPFPSEIPSNTPESKDSTATVDPEQGDGGGPTKTPTSGPTKTPGTSVSAGLSEVSGDVSLQIPGTDVWIAVGDDVSFTEGASILTGEESTVKITLIDGSIVRLESQTKITIDEMRGDDEDAVIRLTLEYGQAWHVVERTDFSSGNSYEVMLPDDGSLSLINGSATAAVASKVHYRQVFSSHDQTNYFSTIYNTNGSVTDIVCLNTSGHCQLENEQSVTDMNSGDQCQIFGGGNHFCALASQSTIDAFGTSVPEIVNLTPTNTPTNTPTITNTPAATVSGSSTGSSTSSAYAPQQQRLWRIALMATLFTMGMTIFWKSSNLEDD